MEVSKTRQIIDVKVGGFVIPCENIMDVKIKDMEEVVKQFEDTFKLKLKMKGVNKSIVVEVYKRFEVE